MSPTSIFAEASREVYRHRFTATVHVHALAGGVPTDQKVAEGWIRTKLGITDEAQIQAMAAEAIAERMIGGTPDDTDALEAAVAEVIEKRHLTGFKRDELGPYIEGRQVKAALKEAANVRWAGEKWGPTRKGTKNFWAEHFFVPEERVHIMRDGQHIDPKELEVVQRFVQSRYGSSISYEEVARDVQLSFTVATDFDLDGEPKPKGGWPELWSTAENQGIGASRSQGYGTFVVTQWDKV